MNNSFASSQLSSRRKAAEGSGRGNPLSPLLLNVYLDHVLDRRWRKLQDATPMIRVADDLLVICPDRERAEQAYDRLRTLLTPAAMPLKGNAEEAIRSAAVNRLT